MKPARVNVNTNNKVRSFASIDTHARELSAKFKKKKKMAQKK